MKNIALGITLLAAAFAGQAQALSLAPPLVCTAANAQTNECKVQAACGHWQDQLVDLIGQAWSLQNQLILPEGGSYTKKQQRQARQLKRVERGTDRVRRRLQSCTRKALA